jgi:hypothetical protein
MGMSYQVEEVVVPAVAHVVGSGTTVDWYLELGLVPLCNNDDDFRRLCGLTHQRQLSS